MTLSDIARTLNKDHGHLPPAFFMTDRQAVSQPAEIIAHLPKGAGVILRDYDHPARLALGRELVTICRERELLFLVAGDVSLAEKLMADGVHLPETMGHAARDIRPAHPHWMLTASCHSLAVIGQMEKQPLDALLIAPVFPTHSHPETLSGERETLGIKGVAEMVAATRLPLYALGGVTVKNAGQLHGTGIAGIAAIRGFGQGA